MVRDIGLGLRVQGFRALEGLGSGNRVQGYGCGFSAYGLGLRDGHLRGNGSLYDPTWIISLLRLPVFTPAHPLKHQQILKCSSHFLTIQNRASDTT